MNGHIHAQSQGAVSIHFSVLVERNESPSSNTVCAPRTACDPRDGRRRRPPWPQRAGRRHSRRSSRWSSTRTLRTRGAVRRQRATQHAATRPTLSWCRNMSSKSGGAVSAVNRATTHARVRKRLRLAPPSSARHRRQRPRHRRRDSLAFSLLFPLPLRRFRLSLGCTPFVADSSCASHPVLSLSFCPAPMYPPWIHSDSAATATVAVAADLTAASLASRACCALGTRLAEARGLRRSAARGASLYGARCSRAGLLARAVQPARSSAPAGFEDDNSTTARRWTRRRKASRVV